jgi:oligopeptide/dipeptide ABC transporter ATP-binding protein
VALVEIRNLTKTFHSGESVFGGRAKGEVRAVDDVSLDIQTGETLGLVGESGSGKSTLGRLVLCLIEPTSGSVRFNGRDLLQASHGELRRLRREMQIIFQDPFGSLDPRMRVEDVIAEPLTIHENMSKSARRTRAAELLRAVGLDESALRRYPHEFSGGQRQRIAIARALVTYPRFIVLDEPVSALDVSIRAQILNLLKRLQDRLGLAYLMISHDLAAARYLATRLAVMYAGKLVETGACDTVYTEPLHPYTEALLSAALPLHPSARRTRVVLGGEVPDPVHPPAGCRFHPRCPRAMAECRLQEPEWREAKPGRFVACHLY